MCPWKLGQGHRNIKRLFKLSQWYTQTTTCWFIRYHAFTQERDLGSGTLILTSSLTGSAQKYVPPPLEWGEIKRVVYVWRQTKPNVAASKNGRKKGKIKLSFATIECNVWQNAGVHFSLLCSKLLCILFAHTCIYLSWFMSQFLVKCLVNGEILSAWWIYTHSFTVAASQIIGKYGEL